MADQTADFVASSLVCNGYYYPVFPIYDLPIPRFPEEQVTEPGLSVSQEVSDDPEDWDSDVTSDSNPEEEADRFDEAEQEEADNVGSVQTGLTMEEKLQRFLQMRKKNMEENKGPVPQASVPPPVPYQPYPYLSTPYPQPVPDMSLIQNNLQTLTDLLNGFKEQHSQDIQNLTEKVFERQNEFSHEDTIHQKYWSLVEENDSAQAKIRELESRVNDRDVEIVEKNEKMEKMEMEMKEKDEVIRKQGEKIEELKTDFFEMDIANHEFQLESEKMKEQMKEMDVEITKLRNVEEKLQEQIQKTQLLQSMYEELAETKAVLSRELDKLQELQKVHNEHLEDYQSQLYLETQAHRKSEKNHKEAQRIVMQQKRTIEKLNEKIGALEQEIQHLKDYADSRDRRIEELDREVVQILTDQETLLGFDAHIYGYEYDPQTGNRWGDLGDQ